MIFLPQFTRFGQLELLEIYEYYDKPLLVSCQNAVDRLFLAVLIEDEPEYEKWLFSEMSKIRFENIRSGRIDLHEAYSDAELGFVYSAMIFTDQSQHHIFEIINIQDLTEDMLPQKGQFIQIHTETKEKFRESLTQKAVQGKRTYLRLHLEFPNIFRTEAPVRPLAQILSTTQELISSIGQEQKNAATERGLIPVNIMAGNELLVSGVGPGSFEVELVSAQLVDLFNESDIENSILEFVNLINLGSDADKLKEKVKQLKHRAAKNYHDFLGSISEVIDQLTVEWASPKENHSGHAEISATTAKIAMQIIELTDKEEKADIVVEGKLTGANIRLKTYEILSKDSTSYIGKISDQVTSQVNGSIIGDWYRAQIRQITSYKIAEDKPEIKYELIGLIRISPPSNSLPDSKQESSE